MGGAPPGRGALPARVVMDLLSHPTIGMTLGTFSHVLPDMQRDAADRMDAVLGS